MRINRNEISQGFSKVILIAIIASVGLIGLSAYLMAQVSTTGGIINPTSPQTQLDESVKGDQIISADAIKSSIPELVSRGDNLECEWNIQVDDSNNPFNTGVVWTSGKQGRSYMNSLQNGFPMESNVIFKDAMAYSWNIVTGTKTGYKFTQAQLDDANARMTPEQRQQADQIRQEMYFNCKPWTPDASKFIIPRDVYFRIIY